MREVPEFGIRDQDEIWHADRALQKQHFITVQNCCVPKGREGGANKVSSQQSRSCKQPTILHAYPMGNP